MADKDDAPDQGDHTIISRADAQAAGLKNYFTGETCGRGHIAPRQVVNGRCVECRREDDRRHAVENPHYQRDKMRKLRAADPQHFYETARQWRSENKERHAENGRRWRKENPDKYREAWRRQRAAKPEQYRETDRRWREATKERRKELRQKWLANNRERMKEYYRKWARENPDSCKAYRKKWRENNQEAYVAGYQARNKRYRIENADKVREMWRRYKTKNRARVCKWVAERQAAARIRTPAWADLDAITEFYLEAARLTTETGITHHVDHVIPLRGKTVSGLHVPNNLQVITAAENKAKGRRFLEGEQ